VSGFQGKKFARNSGPSLKQTPGRQAFEYVS